MKKNYQTTTRRAGTSGRTTPKKATADPHRTKYETAVTLPEAVTVAVGELASELEEGLLAFAVGAGLKVLDVILEEEAIQMAGPRGIHDPDREAVRHGTEDGLVALGGRQVSIRRPRLRTADRGRRGGTPDLCGLHLDRVAGPRDAHPHDGQALHPPLRCRPRAGGQDRGGEEPLHLQVGGVPAVRGGHRDRPGRADGGRSEQPRPGRLHGRRSPFRRSLLWGGPRHRH